MDKETKITKIKSNQEKKTINKNITIKIKPLKLSGGQKKSK